MQTLGTFNYRELPSPCRVVMDLPVFSLLGREFRIPVLVAKGAREGPAVIVTAGIHGDEFEGMEAIRRMYGSLNPEEMSGTFIGLPVCNVLAYENQSRESPVYADGLNLARVFPGKADGSYTVRLAHELFTFVTGNLDAETDVFIDFHSAGTRYAYVPLIAMHRVAVKRRESERLCRLFGIERLWEIPSNRGTFNGAVSQFGITTLATEVTGRGGLLEEDVDILVRGVRNILHALGIQRNPRYEGGEEAIENRTTVFTSQTLYFKESGLFLPSVRCGERIAKGQFLGKVTDMTGRTLEEIYSPSDSEIWGIRTFSSIYAGDISFLLGMPLSDTNHGGEPL